jgi:hypothetical protein
MFIFQLTPSYETTPKWLVSFSIKLAAFQASGAARMKLHGMAKDD